MKECNTTQIKEAYRRYLNVSTSELGEVYTTWSQAKENAYYYCLEQFRKYNRERFRIIGANSCIFSVGFIGEINEKKAFFYITHTADRFTYLN